MSQLTRVRDRLLKNKFITRNECLQNYITRLGAHIVTLKEEGMDITGKYIKTPHGQDYKYTLNQSDESWFDNLK